MPSGAKKRKAAKKKKEKQANSNSLHGDQDPKVHEEKESDSGETNSPLLPDNHNSVHFEEGEDKRKEGTSPAQSAITKSESVGVNGNGEISDKVAVEAKSSIQIGREINLKGVTIEHVEIEDTSSSSSSSDEESKVVGKNIEVINCEEPIEYAPNLPTEVASVIDLGKTSYEESYKDVPMVDDHDLVVAKSKVEISDLVSETIPQVEPVILFKDEVHLDENLGSMVNGKSEISEVPSSVIDIGSQSNVDTLSTKETEDGEVTKIAFVGEGESRTLPQSSIPVVDKVNGSEHKKESEIESMDRQTQVALPPRPVQASSSMGCCGLFELFMGSKR